MDFIGGDRRDGRHEPTIDEALVLMSKQQAIKAAGGGATGPAGGTGPVGGTGVAGPTGAAGPAGIFNFANFYANMPGDNAATVAVGAAVQFPHVGPSGGTLPPTQASASTVTINASGTYEVTWQVSVTEAGQLQIALNGSGVANTVAGRATGTSQISGSTIITATVGQVLSIINPAGNSTALTITPTAGGASAVSATLTLKRLA